MSVKQDPKGNANPLPPPQSPPSQAEHQRRYRERIQRQSKAYLEIRAIIARLESES